MAKTKFKKLTKKQAKTDFLSKEVDVEELTVGIPGLFQPSEYDLNDELEHMDGYRAYQSDDDGEYLYE